MDSRIPLFIPIEPISIITYNLLYPQKRGMHAEKFSNPIGYSFHHKSKKILENTNRRLKMACQHLLNSHADILCLQEVTQETFALLSKKLIPYQGSYAMHPNHFHGVAIFFLRNKFIHLNTVQNQAQLRSHLMIDLMATNLKIIRIASCHLRDPRDFERPVKTAQISQILEDMKPKRKEHYRIDASIIAGDFNQDQWGDRPKEGKTVHKPKNPNVAHATMFAPLIALKYQTDESYRSSEYKRKRLNDKTSDKSNVRFYSQPIIKRDRKIDYIWIRTINREPPRPLFSHSMPIGASDHAPVGSIFNL